jgi:hypothetical protein
MDFGPIQQAAQTTYTAVLPVLLGVLALGIGLKLVKRFANRI